MNKLKNNKLNSIFVISAFIFNILIFAPLEIYFTNKNELWFKIKDILPIIISFAILIFVIAFLLTIFLKGKKKDIFLKIIFALTTTLYIQGNFLNFGYNVLDGSKIEWGNMIYKGMINILLWALIIIIPYGIKKLKKEENFKIFMTIISIAIIFIEIITLTTVIINQSKQKVRKIELNNQDIFDVSKKDNIIVFMSDTFEGIYMNKILKEYPEYKEKLKDFTYFDNCTGVSFFTYSSMPTLLTGVECKVGNTLKENMEYCFENSRLYEILKQNNYRTEIYAEKVLTPKDEIIDNLGKADLITTSETKVELTKKMYKYTMYRYLPHFLKKNFVLDDNEFYRIKKSDKALSYQEKSYFLDDVAFNDELLANGITTKSNTKVFKFYETNGMHTPYDTTVNLQYDTSEEYFNKSDEEKRFNEALSSINLLCNYIDELKKAEAYDNTNIIFLADHGYYNRFHTNLLAKKAYDNHEFKVSSAPVSLLEDLEPTILNMATNTKNYGKDFFDYGEDEDRTREVQDFTYEVEILGSNAYKIVSKMVFQTKGKAENKDSFYIVDEEYENEEKELKEKYNFGDIINFDNLKDSHSINLIGFAIERVGISLQEGCNISKNTFLEINRIDTDKDIIANFEIKRVYESEQTINFKIDGETIYSCKVNKKGSKEVSFKIPKEIWNSKEKLIIEMEFPDAILGKQHATAMLAIRLESFNFSNTN